MEERGASAIGIATASLDGGLLGVWYPAPILTQTAGQPRFERLDPKEACRRLSLNMRVFRRDRVRDVEVYPIEVSVPDLNAAVGNVADAFLRLHLLSLRFVRPREISLDNLIDVADHNIAWTSSGPCRPMRIPFLRSHAYATGRPFAVHSLYPFPPMLDFVTPSGVTIADPSRVLLGAYLAPGTMVTRAGACNFNAGSLGPCMIEGRISAGVVIGEGSHIGGGASLMGSISGGGRQIVSTGKRCLVGANAGVGISLGDDCLVEAGCYITAGSIVRLPNGSNVKAMSLSGHSRLIFRRNSINGSIEAIENRNRWVGLDPRFHPASEALGFVHNEEPGQC